MQDVTIVAPPVPQNRAQLATIFGNLSAYVEPNGKLLPTWEAQNIVTIPLPIATPIADGTGIVKHISVHRLLAPFADGLYRAIATVGLWDKLGPYGGGFCFRPNKNDPSLTSLHAWGIAWDWDPDSFPNGSLARRDPALIAIFAKYGFMCGEDFVHTKDPMHFQYARHL